MKIKAPEYCPSCDSRLVLKTNLLYCINDSCSAKSSKKLEHFVKTLKIKGLGTKTLDKLDLENTYDLFNLSLEDLERKINSIVLAKKILLEIDKSRDSDLQVILQAFSIPLLGKSASEKLCKRISNIDEITQETCKEAGLGLKVTNNLLEWLNWFDKSYYPFSFNVSTKSKKSVKEVICITGKLKSFSSKAKAKEVLENLGYVIKDSVTKEVTIVVNESGIESTKIKKARNNNITIISDIKKLIGE